MGKLLKGIDVSRWQGTNPDLDKSTLAFAYIKATQGTSTDPKLWDHNAEVNNSHLAKGFYHFYQAGVDPVAQANAFCAAVLPLSGIFTMPPVLDLEDKNLHTADMAALQEFLDTVEQGIGKKPMIYTNKYFMQEMGFSFPGYKLWDASYRSGPATPYAGWESPTMWQYTDGTTVEGEAAPVDGDLFYGGAEELLAFIGAPTFKDGSTPADWVSKYNVQVLGA